MKIIVTILLTLFPMLCFGNIKVLVPHTNLFPVLSNIMTRAQIPYTAVVSQNAFSEVTSNVWAFGDFPRSLKIESQYDFTHSVAVITRKPKTFWQEVISCHYVKTLWKTILQPRVVSVGLLLLVFVVFFSHLIWFVDLGDDKGVSDKYWKGIGEALYFGFVTISTVGYGDFTPKKPITRVVTVAMICLGIAFFSNFLATLSASYVAEDELKVERNAFMFPENNPYHETLDRAILATKEDTTDIL